jgi:hypothetical protein
MQKTLKMKTFSQYYQVREEDEQGLADMGGSGDESNLLLKVAKMAISNHKESTLDFFHALARNDENIRRILGKFTDSRNSNSQAFRIAPKDKDIIAPNSADMQGPV